MFDFYTVHVYPTVEEQQMHTMSFINKVIREGRQSDMILVTEAIQEKQLIKIAETIAGRETTRIVLIAGPSSSGKTSTSKRLCIQLMACGKHPVALSMDNWYVDREDTVLDEEGKPDFENIHSMDLNQFHADLDNLLNGKEVALPTFNFTKGKREYNGERLTLEKDMILVIEGIHALNPIISENIPASEKFKIFAAPMSPIALDDERWIPTTANRLLRRISRDLQTRGKSAQQTIAGWPSVARGEEKWILPFKDEADVVFDTSMLYELAALRPKAEKALKKVPVDSAEHEIANRLLGFLECFCPISPEFIPKNSLLREFIGGSAFDVA